MTDKIDSFFSNYIFDKKLRKSPCFDGKPKEIIDSDSRL
jgi:hypothetical protein